jgi:hypothetical protein
VCSKATSGAFCIALHLSPDSLCLAPVQDPHWDLVDVCDSTMADEKETNQPTGTATAMGEETEQSAHKTAAQKMNHDARLATEKEHNMTLWQGIKLYPKAVAWSVLISTCIAMEGYDLCLLSNFYGFPQFNRYVIRLPLPKNCPVTSSTPTYV